VKEIIVNTTEKVKQYLQQFPKATGAEVAKKCKTTISYVYIIRSQMKKAATKAKKIKTSAKPEGVNIDKAHDSRMPRFSNDPLPVTMHEKPNDPVSNPAHYTDGGIETIDFIEAKRLGYHLGNVVKYISRASKKGTNTGLEDLRKAQWYLARAIERNETTVSR
jgi:hypothetical protein